ncbi:unnamed protein product, partial [Rotaria sordida]
TNFHTFSSGNDWGYSEFLDGNYLNSRRNDLITDDRLRVYVGVVVDGGGGGGGGGGGKIDDG